MELKNIKKIQKQNPKHNYLKFKKQGNKFKHKSRLIKT